MDPRVVQTAKYKKILDYSPTRKLSIVELYLEQHTICLSAIFFSFKQIGCKLYFIFKSRCHTPGYEYNVSATT